jgi:peroxiredoxin
MQNLDLPNNLPIPEDDGACNHLTGSRLPNVTLPATDGTSINPSGIPGWLVIYCYPMTGRPDTALPERWDEIPGARGCTPQSCSFRDHHQEIQVLKTRVFGLSVQNTDYQAEAVERLHLPFPLLSDSKLEFASALNLPMLEVEGMHLLKRVTMIAKDGVIQKVFYPVFPPDKNIDDVLVWLRENVS